MKEEKRQATLERINSKRWVNVSNKQIAWLEEDESVKSKIAKAHFDEGIGKEEVIVGGVTFREVEKGIYRR